MARRLPLLPTQFTGVDVPLGFDGLSLFVDGNSKVTAENGTYDCPAPNAFSLPHIATCPGSTEACRESCYVHNLEAHAPAVFARYKENERTAHAILADSFTRREAAKRFGEWIRENCKGGFRWHVSGDVFSERYAHFIAYTCQSAPRVNFWIYTRSHRFVAALLEAPNLVVNISADRDNYSDARAVAHRYGLRLCYMVKSPDEKLPPLPSKSVIFPDYPMRARPQYECAACNRGHAGFTPLAKSDLVNGTCPACFSLVREVVPDLSAHAWWNTLTHEQQKMVCPADMLGQSDNYRCGKTRCSHCLVLHVSRKGAA